MDDRIEEIAHLDFLPEGIPTALRERAEAAWEGTRVGQELLLQRITYERLADVLGETNGTDVVTTVTNVKDGDGEVELTIDGLRFKVRIVFSGTPKDGEPQQLSINLTVQKKDKVGWLGVSSLETLGKFLTEGLVG